MKGTTRIKTMMDAARVAAPMIGDWQKEHVIGLYLNTALHVTKVEIVSIGSVNASIVHPREMFKPAVVNSAVSVIMVHNHPSGDLTPSKDDVTIYGRLRDAGEILGISLIDSIIINEEGDCASLNSEGGE